MENFHYTIKGGRINFDVDYAAQNMHVGPAAAIVMISMGNTGDVSMRMLGEKYDAKKTMHMMIAGEEIRRGMRMNFTLSIDENPEVTIRCARNIYEALSDPDLSLTHGQYAKDFEGSLIPD